MEIIVRSSVIYLFLFLIMRAIGRRSLAQMTAFEIVILLVMGDIVQQGVTQEDMSLVGAILAVSTMALWLLAFSYVTFRFRRGRDVLDGVPLVIVTNGQIVREALQVERLHTNELMEQARNRGIDDLAKVRLAVLEPDGTFSFFTDDRGGNDDGDEQVPPPPRPAR